MARLRAAQEWIGGRLCGASSSRSVNVRGDDRNRATSTGSDISRTTVSEKTSSFNFLSEGSGARLPSTVTLFWAMEVQRQQGCWPSNVVSTATEKDPVAVRATIIEAHATTWSNGSG